jgi:membrane-associated HD superfamily phosphohydrolase
MNTIGNSCFALGISPKREKCFGVLSSTKAFIFLENFEKKLLKKSMVFGLGSNVFICAKI